MDANVTTSIISASSAVIVAITALILNTFWVRHSIEKQGASFKTEIEALRTDMNNRFLALEKLFDAKLQRVEEVLDARLKQVEQILKLR